MIKLKHNVLLNTPFDIRLSDTNDKLDVLAKCLIFALLISGIVNQSGIKESSIPKGTTSHTERVSLR